MMAVQVFLILLSVLATAVLIGSRTWGWQVSRLKKSVLSNIRKWRAESVTVEFFYSPGTLTQIEHSLKHLIADLTQMEKVWGVRFYIIISLPESIAEEKRKAQVLERKFPQLSFVYEGG